jgi:hypothetical protein
VSAERRDRAITRSWPTLLLLTLTAVLLSLGAFLSWRATGSEVSATPTLTGAAHAEHGANGGAHEHPIDENHLLDVLAEENEARDKLPANATLLTMLALVASFGLALGWLPASGWSSPRSQVSLLIRCCFHSIVHVQHGRPVATLLGVFRL